MIHVIVADDHPLMRAGIRAHLAEEPDMILDGEAADSHEVRTLCQKFDPDVILLDLIMPGPPVFETIAYLREHHPKMKVVILTAYDDEAFVRSLAPHVEGYVLKDETTAAVIRAIRAVTQGDTWFSQPIVDRLAQLNSEESIQPNEPALTRREWEVLRLLAGGKTNREIAQELDIRPRTVAFHMENLLTKLGVSNRVQAVTKAVQCGWFEKGAD